MNQKRRKGRHCDVLGAKPEVASDPKYYQKYNVIRIKVDFNVKSEVLTYFWRNLINRLKIVKKKSINMSLQTVPHAPS